MKLSKEDVLRQTESNLRRVEHIHRLSIKFKEDADKKIRLQYGYCIFCWYSESLAGQAFTEYTCAVCGKEGRHPNTNVPKICIDCSKKHKLCVECGADIALRNKRRGFSL